MSGSEGRRRQQCRRLTRLSQKGTRSAFQNQPHIPALKKAGGFAMLNRVRMDFGGMAICSTFTAMVIGCLLSYI